MTIRSRRSSGCKRILCVILAVAMGLSPSVSAVAQTNAAAMAVRQRVEGLQPGPEGQPATVSPEGQPPVQTTPSMPVAGPVDTRFISPDAAIVLVARPAQLLATPVAQVFPVEVASAAGTKFLGFDPAQMNEIVAFSGPFNPAALAYSVTIKFKDPIRAASIPPERRGHAQLSELGGKKYLKSAVPMMPSFYGPNNKTLVLATDQTLQQLIQSAGQPKTGPMMERLNNVPPGSDLYLSVDLTTFKPLIQAGLMQAQANAPPEMKALMELPTLISAAELTLNLSNPGPSSLVVHCTDEAAAQKFESTLQVALQKARAAQQPGADDVIAQAMSRYTDRMVQVIQPQRNGTSVNCFRLDGQNPTHREVLKITLLAAASIIPGIMGVRQAAPHNRQVPLGGGIQPPTGEQPPTPPAAQPHP